MTNLYQHTVESPIVQEADLEPGEDRRDVCLTSATRTPLNQVMALCNLEEWLMRMSIQR